MLPHAIDGSAVLLELHARVLVSLTITTDLRQPEAPASLGLHEVLRAAVPEATVDKDVEPDSSERQVCSAP